MVFGNDLLKKCRHFVFPKKFCALGLGLELAESVFGQTFIRASVPDPFQIIVNLVFKNSLGF